MIHTSSINRGACEASVTVSSQIWLIGNLHCVLPAPCESTKLGYGETWCRLRWARQANHGQLWMQHLVRLQAKQKILSNHRLFHFIGSVVYRNCQNVSARSKPLKNCRSHIVRGLFTDCLFLKCLCVYQLLWPVALPEVLSRGTFSGETGLHLCYQAQTCWQSKGMQFESVLSQQSLL